MALSNGTTVQRTFVRINWLKKDQNDPHFSKTVKQWDEWVQEGRFSEVSGQFKEITFRTIGEDKEKRRVFSLVLEDEGEEFELQCGFNSIGKNILNCLASVNSLGKLTISVYKSKTWFPSVYVKNNNIALSWKLTMDEQRALTTPITNPKTGEVISNDYSDLEKTLEGLMGKFSLEWALAELESLWTPVKEDKKVDDSKEIDDDLPFKL